MAVGVIGKERNLTSLLPPPRAWKIGTLNLHCLPSPTAVTSFFNPISRQKQNANICCIFPLSPTILFGAAAFAGRLHNSSVVMRLGSFTQTDSTKPSRRQCMPDSTSIRSESGSMHVVDSSSALDGSFPLQDSPGVILGRVFRGSAYCDVQTHGYAYQVYCHLQAERRSNLSLLDDDT